MSIAETEPTPSPASLVPVPGGGSLVRQAAPTTEIIQAQQAYHDLCGALLDASDYQRIGRKDFPKKSAWRKLNVAFNVDTEIIDRTYERDDRGRIIRAEVMARAIAPNGRHTVGIGACDLFEKCCPGADGNPEQCSNKSDYHRHCPPGCSGSVHFSNPSHDLPATAATRATNRACADLYGMGEVSAEEVNASRPAEHEEPPDPFPLFGWESKAEHDDYHARTAVIVKALPKERRDELKAWVEANGIGWSRAHSKGEAEALLAAAELLRDRPEEAEQPAETATGSVGAVPTYSEGEEPF